MAALQNKTELEVEHLSSGFDDAGLAFPSTQDEMEELMPEILALVPEYVAGRFRELHRLKLALESGNFETIEIIGHNFKGTGSSFGFPLLTSAGAAMETAAHDRDLESIRNLASLIERTLSAY